MPYETILSARHDVITTITLNHPERLNALDKRMVEELLDALAHAEGDGATRAVVLTGAGRAFCIGADLHDPGGPRGGRLHDDTPESKRQGLRHGIPADPGAPAIRSSPRRDGERRRSRGAGTTSRWRATFTSIILTSDPLGAEDAYRPAARFRGR